MRLHKLLTGLCFSVLVLAGCARHSEDREAAQAPAVKISQPIVRDVTAYEPFTGRTEAAKSIDIRARVSGYLDKVLFEPGTEVKKNQPLFKIDPRPYKATLDQAEGQVALNLAKLERYSRDVARNRPLVATRAVSEQEFDKNLADRGESEGSVQAAKANVESAKLDLLFTDVLSPIDGRVSRDLISAGNLVVKDQTLLTTVVSEDPIYAYFDVDERTMLNVQRLIREGKFKSARRDTDVPVYMGLANEDGYPHKGTINFVNNQVDTATGTLNVRGTFENKPDKNGNRVLSPGLFVHIHLPIGDPHKALLVSERAIVMDQGLKFIYVVDDKNKVQRREVVLGTLHDGLREVEKGLEEGDWVVVAGLQRLVPNTEVKPERVDMPLPPKTTARPAPAPKK